MDGKVVRSLWWSLPKAVESASRSCGDDAHNAKRRAVRRAGCLLAGGACHDRWIASQDGNRLHGRRRTWQAMSLRPKIMRMRNRMLRKEWLLLVLPCLFLLGFGFYLRWSKEQPFELVAEKMFVAPSSAIGGYDTKVTLVMIPKGSWPGWLTQPSTTNVPAFSWSPYASVFYNRNNKKTEVIWPAKANGYTLGAAIYDKKQNRFTADTWLNLAEVPKNLGRLTCEAKMTLLRLGLPYHRGRYKTTVITTAKSVVVVRP